MLHHGALQQQMHTQGRCNARLDIRRDSIMQWITLWLVLTVVCVRGKTLRVFPFKTLSSSAARLLPSKSLIHLRQQADNRLPLHYFRNHMTMATQLVSSGVAAAQRSSSRTSAILTVKRSGLGHASSRVSSRPIQSAVLRQRASGTARYPQPCQLCSYSRDNSTLHLKNG